MTEPLSYKELEQLVKQLQTDKKQVVEELDKVGKLSQSREDFYQQIIDLTNEGMMIVQGDQIKYINATALLLLESSQAEVEQISLSDLIVKQHKGEVIQNISDIISGKVNKSEIETDIITPKNKVIRVNVVVERLDNPNNQNLLLIKLDNIEKYKEKEREANNLRSVVDLLDSLIQEGVLIFSKPSNGERALFSWLIEDSNKAAADFLGKSKNELLKESLGNFMVPDYEYEISEEIEVGFTDDFELFITNLNKHIHFTIKCISKDRISCQFIETTEINQIRNQLNTNLQRNELITEVLSVFNSGKIYTDKLNIVLEKVAYHFKPNRILVLFHEEKNTVGKLMAQYAHKDYKAYSDEFVIPFKRVTSYLKMLEEKNMILGFALKYLPEDLQGFFKGIQIESAYVFPIMVENEMHGSILFETKADLNLDNTEINYLKMISVLISSLVARHHNEEKILAAKNKAEEADRLKSSFLANMSHDIRIPMTAIIGFSDLLADPDLSISEREEFVELISKSGQDLLTLVDNIIDVAKIETGQFRVHNEKISLENLLKDLFTDNLRNPKVNTQDDLELILDFHEKYLAMPFETDAFRFKQVFHNLIDNAIKFTESGVIRFGVSNVADDMIEFYVQDSGIGIAEETQHIIFERFGKIDRSYTKEYNGTGLGLALCKSIVEIMKGRIRVLSYPGKGSTFYFTHPVPKGALNQIEEPSLRTGKLPYNWQGKTILIAEDVEQNFKYLQFMLAPTGVTVKWAINGQVAIDYFQKGQHADLVLMDIRMPIVNGIEATKEILKIISLPIIAQTAYTFGDEKHLAMQAGCSSYLTKPIHSNDLLPLLDSILKKPDSLG